MRTLLLLASLLFLTGPANAADWSFWRGPEKNGVSREKDLPESFDVEKGENVIWKAPVGGRTTPIIQKGRVYFLTRLNSGVNEQERVVCLDANTGKTLWEKAFNVFLTDIVSDRLGWTFMVGDPETNTVVAHGTQGHLICFDQDGKIVWQRQLTEEFGRVSGYGGRTTSPIIDGDNVIIGMANSSYGVHGFGGCRFVALNKKTGQVVWWGETGVRVKDTYYSVPVVAMINGERLLISGGADGGVHAFQANTGVKVWSYIFGDGAVNCSPVVDGNLVYIGHGETNSDVSAQGRVICLDASKVENGKPALVWKKDGIKVKFASPLLYDGRLYVCNDLGRMFCYDAKTGKQHWSFLYGKNSKGSPVWADGKIYVGEVDGRFLILKPEDKKCTRLHAEEFGPQQGADAEINGSPAIVDGKIYFMTSFATYCIGKKDHSAKADPIPADSSKEEPAPKDAKPAHVQIIPADVTLHPGEKVELTARTFDAKGRFIGEAKVDWVLAGSRWPVLAPVPPTGIPTPPPLKGELSATKGSATTTLTIPAGPPQFGEIHAKLGDLTGYCKVRVAPKLPYAPNFTPVPDGRPIAGWVNGQGKFMTATLPDGTKVVRKTNINPSPLVARSYAYVAMPELKDYTTEAEVQATRKGADMSDVAVCANRYSLMLMGNTQELRLQSWEALPRVNPSVPFKWEPGTWYKMKITTEKVGTDKLKIMGKVWQADKPEPKEWTIEFTDPTPNWEGAPAIYGYSAGIDATPGTETYYKNIKVTPNAK